MAAQPSRLDSYGAFDDGWGLREPVIGVDALAQRLTAARRLGQRVTARAGGFSFHDQAQGDHVLDLSRLGIAPQVTGNTLRAGASTTLRQLLDAALAAGHTVPILPSSSYLTLGGALATAGISRGSVAYGRAWEGVLSLTLLTPDGTLRTLRRPSPGVPDDEATLFRAVVGGFGAIGVIVDVTQRILPLPWTGVPRVETVATSMPGPADVVGSVLAALREPAPDPDAPWRGHTDATLATPWAVTHEEGRAIAFTHRLVDPHTRLSRFGLHTPGSVSNQLGQWAASVNASAAAMPYFLHGSINFRRAPYVDPLHDASFMMDGGVAAQRVARRIGVRMGVIQQSYALPVGPGVDDSGPTLRFLEATFRRVRDARVAATVVDLLGVPGDTSLLSACAGRPGVVVSVAFQHLGGARVTRAAQVLEALSEDALALGGRVHLVKHVLASPEVLRAMYGEAVRAWTAVRDRYDPERVLTSRLLDRLEAAAGLCSNRRPPVSGAR